MSESTTDDAAVLTAVRDVLQGKRESFRVIVDTYRDTVYRIAYSFLRSETDSEEAVQEIFLRVYRSLDRFKIEFRFSPWIIGIAYNYLKSTYRRSRKRTDREVVIDDGSLISQYEEPDLKAERSEMMDSVRLAVDSLPKKLREVTILYYLEELSVDEVAEALGLGKENVKSRLFRARKKLRKTLLSVQPDAPDTSI